MNKDLDELIQDAVSKEKELAVRSEELALKDKQFADYLTAKKKADDELEVLWGLCKDFMVENNITEHKTDFIELKLTPSGKFKLVESDQIKSVDDLPDSICDIKKTISNKKVKSYFELNGTLPDGVESAGFILRKKLL